MATQLYFLRPLTDFPQGSSSTALPNSFARADLTTTNTSVGRMNTAAGAALQSGTVSSVNGPTDLQVAVSTFQAEWFTDPFGVSATIAGTITFNLWGLEAAMTANATFRVIIDTITPLGVVGTTVINSSFVTELGTAAAVCNWTGTPTSTVVDRGSRLRIRVFFTDGGGTMVSGSTLTFGYNGGTAAANGDSYVSFTETVTFATFVAGGTNTQYFGGTTVSDANPGAADERRLWTETPGSVNSVTTSVAGPTTAIQATVSAGGSAIEWFTPQLAAVSIDQAYFGAGTTVLESASTANICLVFELALCASDGSSPTVVVVHRSPSEVVISPGGVYQASVAFPTLSISNQQRLRYRIYLDDNTSSSMAAGTLTMPYGVNTGVSVTLPNLTEFVAAVANPPYRSPYPPLLAQ